MNDLDAEFQKTAQGYRDLYNTAIAAGANPESETMKAADAALKKLEELL